jgi:4-hydroxybenzoate polyprenyltransferase
LKLAALLRLLRPALVPTAVADVIAGYVFGGGDAFGRMLAACGASACFYTGGMVLNDLADRERDAYLNPERPLVQHPGLAPQAWGLVLVLFLLGLLLSMAAKVALLGAVVAALAIAYDLVAKKKFPADALTMGAVRAANLGMGFAIAEVEWGPNAWTLLLGYGAYIAGVTIASRTEDFKEDGRRRKGLALAALPMLIGLGALASLAYDAIYFLPGLGVVVLLLHALRVGTKQGARTFVLYALLGIPAVHACLLWSNGYYLGLGVMAALLATSIYLLRLLRPRPGAAEPSAA